MTFRPKSDQTSTPLKLQCLMDHPRAIASKRAMRSAVFGCVENRVSMPPPASGFMIIICAVAGWASAVGNGIPRA